MVFRTDNQLFLGHHRSQEEPDGELLCEDKHPKGGYVGIFQSCERYSYDHYYVVTRVNRRTSLVDVVQPKEYRYQDGGKHRFVDEDFITDWEYQWGFNDDYEAAKKFLAHILDHPEHPAVQKPYKTRRVRDAQRDKVYQWENKFYQSYGKEKLVQAQCTALIHEIEEDFKGLSRRPVTISYRQKGGCYQRGLTEVNIAEYGQNRDVIVHEMAHWVVSNLHHRTSIAGHGAEFVGVFMLMLQRYQGQCLPDMINHAIELNVKFVFPEGGLEGIFERLQPKDTAIAA